MRDLLAQRLDSLSQCFVICRPKSAPMRYSDQRVGYNARNDEIRDNITRMKRAWADQRKRWPPCAALMPPTATHGSGPKIAAALTSKHHWLVVVCDSCGTVVDLDLRVKPRDPEASIRIALRDVRCPRCNGYGRLTKRILPECHLATIRPIQKKGPCGARVQVKDPSAVY